jgi:hypothetical protein
MPYANLTFEQFCHQVDQKLCSVVGVTRQDIPDFDYWNSWHYDCTPSETAWQAMCHAGYDTDDLLDQEVFPKS